MFQAHICRWEYEKKHGIYLNFIAIKKACKGLFSSASLLYLVFEGQSVWLCIVQQSDEILFLGNFFALA